MDSPISREGFQRSVVIGNGGSGKSWLAERLAKFLGVEAVDLDKIHWEPGGYTARRDPNAAISMVRETAAADAWIIEGVYGWLAQEALPRATALIWLDLPEAECIHNLQSRGLRGGGDQASFEALLAWTGEYRTRQNANSYAGHAKLFVSFGRGKLRLRSGSEIAAFLRELA